MTERTETDIYLPPLERKLHEVALLFTPENLIATGASGIQASQIPGLLERVVRVEFVRRSQEEPIEALIVAITDSAKKPEDEVLAKRGVARLNYFKQEWGKLLVEKQTEYMGITGEPYVQPKDGSFFGRMRPDNWFPHWWHSGGRSLEGIDLWHCNFDEPTVTLVGGTYHTRFYDESSGYKEERNEPFSVFSGPSLEYMERVLRALEVIGQEQPIDVLKNLPEWQREVAGSYYINSFSGSVWNNSQIMANYAGRVPTVIAGVDIRIDFLQPMINATFNLEALQRAVDWQDPVGNRN